MIALYLIAGFIALNVASYYATRAPKASNAAPAKPSSKKHVRGYIGSLNDEFRLTYYGDNGRKVTSRTVSTFAEYRRLRAMAAAKGYRVI